MMKLVKPILLGGALVAAGATLTGAAAPALAGIVGRPASSWQTRASAAAIATLVTGVLTRFIWKGKPGRAMLVTALVGAGGLGYAALPLVQPTMDKLAAQITKMFPSTATGGTGSMRALNGGRATGNVPRAAVGNVPRAAVGSGYRGAI